MNVINFLPNHPGAPQWCRFETFLPNQVRRRFRIKFEIDAMRCLNHGSCRKTLQLAESESLRVFEKGFVVGRVKGLHPGIRIELAALGQMIKSRALRPTQTTDPDPVTPGVVAGGALLLFFGLQAITGNRITHSEMRIILILSPFDREVK